MDIRALRYFVELVREQSFTRASEKLFVTQPTISKMIRNMEEELGQPLLSRAGRRFTLTDSGQVLFNRAQTILAEMLLFFVPAVVAVVNYQDLLLQEGWRIMVVLLLSTILVLGTTALVVDRVYRLELKLARRSRRHV